MLQAQQQAFLQAQQPFQHPPVLDPGADPASQPGNQPTEPVTPPNAPGRIEDLPPMREQPRPTRSRAPSTTIDALEREFERKKQRELDQARAAGSNGNGHSNGTAPRLTGEKVGRNDPCPCGSGKKFKKCHGVEA